MQNKKIPLKIPTKYLPKDWREVGAEEFNCSVNKIERIVYGLTVNAVIYEFFVALAEKGKADQSAKENELINRVNALT